MLITQLRPAYAGTQVRRVVMTRGEERAYTGNRNARLNTSSSVSAKMAGRSRMPRALAGQRSTSRTVAAGNQGPAEPMPGITELVSGGRRCPGRGRREAGKREISTGNRRVGSPAVRGDLVRLPASPWQENAYRRSGRGERETCRFSRLRLPLTATPARSTWAEAGAQSMRGRFVLRHPLGFTAGGFLTLRTLYDPAPRAFDVSRQPQYRAS